jgi:uncharacterized membrane protein YfcA
MWSRHFELQISIVRDRIKAGEGRSSEQCMITTAKRDDVKRLPKEVFVGTSVLLFTFVNWIKLPFFCVDRSLVDLPVFAAEALITPATLMTSATFFPLVPLGVWLGVWMNRHFSEKIFVRVIYAILFGTGLQLICNFDLAAWFR